MKLSRLPLACLIVSLTAGISRTEASHGFQRADAEKQAALMQPVCVLPYGQTIGLSDLAPKSLLSNWASRLSSKLPLSLVSIPATHDAGTALGRTGWTRCQVLTLPAQLALGVRGFDIRLRLVKNELSVYHGEESQKLSFQEVIDAFSEFLEKHPKEFLVMRIREESKAVDSTETFEEAFAKAAGSTSLGKLLYVASSRTEIPTVGKVRGKIVLLDNYGKLPNAIDYPNPTMGVQDDYDTSDMDKKYAEIVSKFQDALAEQEGTIWEVNYTSSSTLQVDQLANAKAVNAKVVKYLKDCKGHLGMVFMNFPGTEEIRSIVQSNFK